MKPRFLVDENLGRREIADGVLRHNRAIDIFRVGDPGVPPIGTLDPPILAFCEQSQRILVTANRHSMPELTEELYATGRRHWGMLKIRRGHEADIGGIVETLILLWELEEAEDYLDKGIWIPL